MAQQNAKELVIKRSTTQDGTTTFSFVCGMRTRTFSISNAEVDTTVPDCDDPTQPIVSTARPGRQTLNFSGDGLFDNDTIGKAVADDARLQRIWNYQIIVPGYGTWTGPYMVGGYEFSGDMDEPLAFSASWVPTDNNALAFAAAA